jgi:hypothetical protein
VIVRVTVRPPDVADEDSEAGLAAVVGGDPAAVVRGALVGVRGMVVPAGASVDDDGGWLGASDDETDVGPVGGEVLSDPEEAQAPAITARTVRAPVGPSPRRYRSAGGTVPTG